MCYLSIPEAAVLWRTTPTVLHHACERKRIKGAVRFGYRWWIPANADRFLEPASPSAAERPL